MKIFNGDYIKRELAEIDRSLRTRVEVFMIGGGAMSFHGIKDATKDVDIIVKTPEEFKALVDALKKQGYREIFLRTEPYIRMGASGIFENPDGFRWDVFVNVVCRGLVLSPAMIERSTRFLTLENMKVNILSPEDIFVFKAITSRGRDRNDMFAVFEKGMDFDVVKKEITAQSTSSKDRAWLAFFFLGLEELKEKYHAAIPYYDDFYELACKDILQTIILDSLGQPKTKRELLASINYPREEVAEQLEKMIEEKVIMVDENGKLRVKSSRKGHAR
jgi:hypothetical protein